MGELELRLIVRRYLEAEMDIAGGAPDKIMPFHEAKEDLMAAVDWMQPRNTKK